MKRLLAITALTLGCIPLVHAGGAAQGEQLYKVYCVQCHGISGHGDGVNVPALSVQPRNHHDTAEMMARSDEELFKAVKEGGKSINKSNLMPAWGGNLDDNEIHALVSYMRGLCCQSGQ